ncbi:MAG: sigma-70 family RNA polymerase sigma factor, partial [Zetaproteobacteria bacterium]|nr:sigma-70 family RNA polymerase sigma factor [Flavobacteriales bacterium]
FEGWIRRIMINECISFLRQQKPQLLIDDNRYFEDKTEHQEQEAFEISDLQQLVDNLPNDFKLVFNLFAIEGLSHKDISNTLKISEQASRLRLFKARTQLKEEYSRLKNATNGK